MAHGQREDFVIITTDNEDGSLSRRYASMADVMQNAYERWPAAMRDYVQTYFLPKLRSMDVGDTFDGPNALRFSDRIVRVG
jgi:hypothetical protein